MTKCKGFSSYLPIIPIYLSPNFHNHSNNAITLQTIQQYLFFIQMRDVFSSFRYSVEVKASFPISRHHLPELHVLMWKASNVRIRLPCSVTWLPTLLGRDPVCCSQGGRMASVSPPLEGSEFTSRRCHEDVGRRFNPALETWDPIDSLSRSLTKLHNLLWFFFIFIFLTWIKWDQSIYIKLPSLNKYTIKRETQQSVTVWPRASPG